jgi:hypothetical protein
MALHSVSARLLGAALLVAAVSGGCGGGGMGGREIVVDEPVRLVRTFDEGETIKYKLSSAGEMAVTEFRTSCTFSDTDTNEIKLAMRFDYAASSISMGDDVIPQESAAALRGKTLEVSLAPNGEVLSFSGMGGEEYFDEGIGQLSMMIQGLFPVLPDEPLTVGYSWTDDLDIPDITSSTTRDFVGETTYTVVGFKEKYQVPCVEVSSVTTFEFEGKVEQQGEAWLMTGSGVSNGTILFSIETGLIQTEKSETTVDFTGEGSTTAGAGASTTLSAGLKLEGTMELL